MQKRKKIEDVELDPFLVEQKIFQEAHLKSQQKQELDYQNDRNVQNSNGKQNLDQKYHASKFMKSEKEIEHKIDQEYFESYSSIGIHEDMLKDEIRT